MHKIFTKKSSEKHIHRNVNIRIPLNSEGSTVSENVSENLQLGLNYPENYLKFDA